MTYVNTSATSSTNSGVVRLANQFKSLCMEKSPKMSKCAALLSWIVLVAFVTFHESAEAVTAEDWKLMITTYNYKTDPCSGIENKSPPEEKAAANSACKGAFDALTRMNCNSCKPCEVAECRLSVVENINFRCACLKTTIGIMLVDRRVKVSSFHDCAWSLRKIMEEKRIALQPAETGVKASLKNKVQKLRTAATGCVDCGSSTASSGPSARRSSSKNEGTFVRGPGETISKLPLCEICGQDFWSEEKLVDHLKLHGGGTTCEFCGGRFPNMAALQAHYAPCAASYLADSEETTE